MVMIRIIVRGSPPGQSKESLQYLGVHMGRNLRWETHITETAKKANKTLELLCCLMPRIRGPSECSRRLLGVTAQSRLLYGASIWNDAMRKKNLREQYQSVQRKLAIRITGRYRTASSEALFVLARTPPIDLLVQKRSETEQGSDSSRGNIHNIMLDRWQNRWNKILIRDPRPRVNRKHGQVSYFLMLFLTGHGSHQAYLRRFGISETDECNWD
ncbi:hypothetical protein Trydic_g19251 [Trypoxylus dichotomus]